MMQKLTMKFIAIIVLLLSLHHKVLVSEKIPLLLQVDLSASNGKMKPIWAWFGYDEPNYTYMKDGKKLLVKLQH
jgi:xylan 1,4-beta-xylosidase